MEVVGLSPRQFTARIDAVLAALSILLGAGLVFLLRLGFDWSQWLPATCMPDLCFCEADRVVELRQPSNTISSLAFCLVAAVVVLRDESALSSAKRAEDKYLFWAAATLVGLGSAFFHASLSLTGQTFDVLGMYLLTTLLLLWSAQRRLRWSTRQRVLAYVLGNAALLTLLILAPALRRYLFGAVIAGVLLLERTTDPVSLRISRRFLAWAAGLLAIGFLIWVADITKMVCYPTSIFQGHALWHLFGAASVLMIYVHYQRGGRSLR
jgi:hypothetical protein